MRADGQQKIEIGKRDPYYKPVKQHQNDTRKQKRMEEAFEAEFFGVPSPTNSNSNSLNARDLGSRPGIVVREAPSSDAAAVRSPGSENRTLQREGTASFGASGGAPPPPEPIRMPAVEYDTIGKESLAPSEFARSI